MKHYFLFPQSHFRSWGKLFDRVSQHVVLRCAAVTDTEMHSCVEHNKLRTLGCFRNVLDVSAAGPPGPTQRSAIICSVHSAVSLSVLLLFHYTCVCSVHSWDVCGDDRPPADLESVLHSVRGSHHVRAGKHLKWWSLHSYFIFTLNTDAATAQRAYTSAQAAPQFVIVLIIEDVYNCSNENLNPDQH